jgi:hypothetical protein
MKCAEKRKEINSRTTETERKCKHCHVLKPFSEFKSEDHKECMKCTEKRKEIKSRTTETERTCLRCNVLKPFSEFKSETICLKCAEKKRLNIESRLREYKRGARTRNLEWSLSDVVALALFQMPCYYCNSHESLNGIDRLDNTQGYILENCAPCCTTCNFGKRDLSEEEFLEMCLKVTAHRFPWAVPFFSTWTVCSSGTNHC